MPPFLYSRAVNFCAARSNSTNYDLIADRVTLRDASPRQEVALVLALAIALRMFRVRRLCPTPPTACHLSVPCTALVAAASRRRKAATTCILFATWHKPGHIMYALELSNDTETLQLPTTPMFSTAPSLSHELFSSFRTLASSPDTR